MRWIREHKIFTTVVAIVCALVIVIFASFASGGGGNFLGESFREVVNVVVKPFTSLGNSAENNVSGIFGYKKLQAENEKLKEDNRRLKEINNNLSLQNAEFEELKDLAESFDFDPFKKGYEAVAGNIIAVDKSLAYSELTVDIGKNKGISVGDIVVDGKGLVGEVSKVNDRTAQIKSVLNINKNVSFTVKNNKSVTGVVHGDGNREMEGYFINSKANAVEGDVIVTSGMGNFPKGIAIGRIDKIEFDNDTQLKMIKVKPSAKITSIQKVAIYK